jgi:hypothetical protein
MPRWLSLARSSDGRKILSLRTNSFGWPFGVDNGRRAFDLSHPENVLRAGIAHRGVKHLAGQPLHKRLPIVLELVWASLNSVTRFGAALNIFRKNEIQ